MSHSNAILTPKGRLLLTQCVVEDGWLESARQTRGQINLLFPAGLCGGPRNDSRSPCPPPRAGLPGTAKRAPQGCKTAPAGPTGHRGGP